MHAKGEFIKAMELVSELKNKGWAEVKRKMTCQGGNTQLTRCYRKTPTPDFAS